MLFKILAGDSSRIDTATTPLHEGWAYFAVDNGGFYIDATRDGTVRRIQINPDEVVWVTPGTTTITEIETLSAAGSLVAARDGAQIYVLTSLDATAHTAQMSCMESAAVSTYTVSGAGWTKASFEAVSTETLTQLQAAWEAALSEI